MSIRVTSGAMSSLRWNRPNRRRLVRLRFYLSVAAVAAGGHNLHRGGIWQKRTSRLVRAAPSARPANIVRVWTCTTPILNTYTH